MSTKVAATARTTTCAFWGGRQESVWEATLHGGELAGRVGSMPNETVRAVRCGTVRPGWLEFWRQWVLLLLLLLGRVGLFFRRMLACPSDRGEEMRYLRQAGGGQGREKATKRVMMMTLVC